jgi:hypothetical protein
MQIITDILIDRSVAQVWQELTEFTKYPEWNPFIKSISGNLAVNEKLQVHIVPPGEKRGMKFAPRVRSLVVEKEFSWKGHLLIPGIFDGEHFFRLEARGPHQTFLIHGEKFQGLLLPLLKNMLANTKVGFEQMNKALKARVES